MRPRKCVLVVGRRALDCGHVRLLLKIWGFHPVYVEDREELEAAACQSGRFDAAVVLLHAGSDAEADYTLGTVPVVLYTPGMPTPALLDAVSKAVASRQPKKAKVAA
jgi:hypothetical protein